MSHRLKCFVAMAFGRDDCDLLYSRQIVPTLRALKLNPIRVDRHQHRDDLNNFIIRMLKDADIVLADLTYARPSVYYEAGFAERASPIIYTVRSDHLSRAQQDDRLWVHFDLGMKKIVAWKSPVDPSFAARLQARMTYLLQPIWAEHATRDRIEAERQQSASLSVTDRCRAIVQQFTGELRRKRFWVRPLFDLYRFAQWRIDPAVAIFAAKMVEQKALSATVVAAESITKKHIETVLNMATGSTLIASGQKAGISGFDEHICLCALSAIPVSRLTAAHPRATPAGSSGCFRIPRADTLSERQHETTAWLLGPIRSERMAKEAAKRSMRDLSDGKTNDYTAIVTPRGIGYHEHIVFERPKKHNNEVHHASHARRIRKR